MTKNSDGSIKLEPINDCSGVTYAQGIYHVWHQCCQNHWDHVISKVRRPSLSALLLLLRLRLFLTSSLLRRRT